MNQQMLNSIKLMELPLMELRERIAEEVETNPALEVSDPEPNNVTLRDTLYKDIYQRKSPALQNKLGDEKRQFLEGVISRPESLKEHILWQWRLQNVSSETRRAGEIIIGNLDGDGFHLVPLDELFNDRGDDVIAEALSIIRALDPPGCAVKNYAESLEVQAKLLLGAEDGKAAAKLLPYLNELKKEKFQTVAKMTKMNSDYVEFLFDKIKELSPFPGRGFSGGGADGGGTIVRFVTPDIEVYREDGDFRIKLNDEELPLLKVSPVFIAVKNNKASESEAVDFVNENVARAKFFINALEKRNNTLLRVTSALVEKQRGFFEKGPSFISPLTQHDIALMLEIDDSTVSRTANSKYIQTEWGIYSIGHFFSNSISGSGSSGSEFSKTSVKEMIKEIISKTEKHKSDNEISRMLEEKGIKIARRTVAKYRNELELQQ